MRRASALLALLASACSMEPTYVRPNPAILASWPVGDPYLAQAEAGLPVLTYSQVFQDPFDRSPMCSCSGTWRRKRELARHG